MEIQTPDIAPSWGSSSTRKNPSPETPPLPSMFLDKLEPANHLSVTDASKYRRFQLPPNLLAGCHESYIQVARTGYVKVGNHFYLKSNGSQFVRYALGLSHYGGRNSQLKAKWNNQLSIQEKVRFQTYLQ